MRYIKKLRDGVLDFNGREYYVSQYGVVIGSEFTDTRGYYRKARIIKQSTVLKTGRKLIQLNCKSLMQTYSVHRLVALAHLEDYSDNLEVDHIDGDVSNNSVDNLRMLTRIENIHSYCKPWGKSKYRGVSYEKSSGKWRARIMCRGKTTSIGRFSTETQAAIAYNSFAKELGFNKEALNDV